MSNKHSLQEYIPLFTLCAFALAQPVFDLLSSNPEFFVARHARPLDIVLLVLILLLPLPFIFCAIEAITRLVSDKAAKLVHGFIVIFLMTVILLPLLKKIENLPDTLVLAGSVLGSIVFSIGYYRFAALRQLVSFMGLALLAFPVLFLFNSPVYNIVFPKDVQLSQAAATDASASIVMVVFDELPVTALMDEKRQIDPVRYPNLAALANTSYWFRNATAVATSTVLAVPAIMTGNYPKIFALPQAENYPNSIFSLLAGSYDMNVSETVTHICPGKVCEQTERRIAVDVNQRMYSLFLDVGVIYLHIILPDQYATKLPPVTQGWNNFWRPSDSKSKNNRKYQLYEDRVGQVEVFIDSIQASDKPGFNFIHITLPHVPYEYLPSGKRYDGGWQIPGLDMKSEQWANNEWLITQGYQRFLLQLGAVDMLIGKLVTRLESLDIYDSSLIVVTSDHGVSFMANSGRRDRGPMSKLEKDIMPIPLLIKAPGQSEQVISDRNIESIDILPTLLDILDIESPHAMDGRSALDSTEQQRQSKTLFYKYKELKQYRTGPVIESKYETLGWKISKFGPGTFEPESIFKVGYGKELIGQRVAEILTAGSASLKVDIDQTLFANVDPEGGFIPARISGIIQRQEPNKSPDELAISVNGVVRAVTQSFESTGDKLAAFSAMVPESSFRKGVNEVEAFEISAADNGTLALLPTKNNRTTIMPTYTISRQDEAQGDMLVSAHRNIPVKPEFLKGDLEYANVKNGAVEFYGWAVDMQDLNIPEAILIFEDGKSVYSGKTTMRRFKIAEKGLLSGFHFVLPLGIFSELGNSNVRLYAVSKQGVASEISYFHNYEWKK